MRNVTTVCNQIAASFKAEKDIFTVEHRNQNVWISALTILVGLSNSLVSSICLKIETKSLNFEKKVSENITFYL